MRAADRETGAPATGAGERLVFGRPSRSHSGCLLHSSTAPHSLFSPADEYFMQGKLKKSTEGGGREWVERDPPPPLPPPAVTDWFLSLTGSRTPAAILRTLYPTVQGTLCTYCRLFWCPRVKAAVHIHIMGFMYNIFSSLSLT